MIEYDDSLLDMAAPVYRVEILNEEPHLRGAPHPRANPRNTPSPAVGLIRTILAADNDAWIGRFCLGETRHCDENGQSNPTCDGSYTHRKDVVLFSDPETAHAVKILLG